MFDVPTAFVLEHVELRVYKIYKLIEILREHGSSTTYESSFPDSRKRDRSLMSCKKR